MTSRRACLLGSAALALAPSMRAFAQQPAKLARVSMLYPGSLTNESAVKAALRSLGHEEGKNIRFDVRSAHGIYADLPGHAFVLVRSKPDLIITQGTPAVLALREQTTSIPIVSMSMADPVSLGVAASLARPGGNVTGLTNLTAELNAKRLAMLKETLPGIRRVAYLMHPDNPAYPVIFADMQPVARALGIEIQRYDWQPGRSLYKPPAMGELESAFEAMAKARVDALLLADDAAYYPHMWSISRAALKQRLPSAADLAMVQAGAMIGYGARGREIARRVASYVDRILKGAKPAELSFEQPAIFDFVINMKTAEALGIRISPEMRLRADRVIE